MKENRRIRILAVVTITYILLAFSWWSILLYQKNRDLFKREKELHVTIHGGSDTRALAEIEARHQRQNRMIVGESIFILASVMVGIWLMTRGFLEELRINRQRRNFLFSITHELKTPVAAIRLVLDSLQRREWAPAQKDKLLRSGLRESDRLQITLDNLLLAARLEHAYTPRPTRRAPGLALAEWIADIQGAFPDRDIRLQSTPEPSGPINLDWTGLEVITRNLCENAVKYSPPDAPVLLSCRLAPGRMILEVQDHGPGVPDTEKERIFQMFYRLGEEERRETKGSGLGLYLAREIARRNGGDIRVRDAEPHGALFTLQLPLNDEAHPAG